MEFTLVICTYHRPTALIKLLNSVKAQTNYPSQILIIDGSIDDSTEVALSLYDFKNLEYFRVLPDSRGLTKQRNIGILKTSKSSKIICFLDDDIVLCADYFEILLETYLNYPDAIGVGGYIIEETVWKNYLSNENLDKNYYTLDGYVRKDSSRFILRKQLNLLSNNFPTYMPKEGHGRSVGFIPPSNKTYKVETFMGGVSSFKKSVFENLSFSEYFEGYGLYEDTDFTLRCSQLGQLYLNTRAKLYHFHEEDGRPDDFKFGKMVVRNGYYVWKVKNNDPDLNSKFKWHLITLVLILIRLSNSITTKNRKKAMMESLGRIHGWMSLAISKPIK